MPQPVPALGVIVLLSELMEEAGTAMRRLNDLNITGLTADSRAVKPGFLFAALPGAKEDGRAYIDDAVGRGAKAILAPDGTAYESSDVQLITDANPRQLFARLASRYFKKQPEITVAITGTNGKTSVAQFTRQIWSLSGCDAAALGTLGVVSDGVHKPGSLTTPDPVSLHKLLAEIAEQGIDHLALEASSHGLDQYRLDGVRVCAAAFTNLSRDHLDYHADMAAYLTAKTRLFSEVLVPGGLAVLNADIEQRPALEKACASRGHSVITYGKLGDAIRLNRATPTGGGQLLDLEVFGKTERIHLPLAGDFQAMNALCAAGLALATGVPTTDVIRSLEHLSSVPGRMELIGQRKNGAAVYVDYAHTSDALATALSALRPHATKKLVVVFGAGGDRDTGKRPLMGQAAAEFSDIAYVTDDNPRSEDPNEIRRDILGGCPNAFEIGDRAEAIEAAVSQLEAGDVLLIAGKGHETGQIVGSTVLPFDDREIAQTIVKALDRVS